MLLNLTPHPIRFFPVGCADNVDPNEVLPIAMIYPATGIKAARIGEISLGTVMNVPLGVGPNIASLAGNDLTIPVEYVEYTAHGGLVEPLPPEEKDTWLIVSLVVAMQQTYIYGGRGDLLVPYREVRNLGGTVIGCRQLAKPV